MSSASRAYICLIVLMFLSRILRDIFLSLLHHRIHVNLQNIIKVVSILLTESLWEFCAVYFVLLLWQNCCLHSFQIRIFCLNKSATAEDVCGFVVSFNAC